MQINNSKLKGNLLNQLRRELEPEILSWIRQSLALGGKAWVGRTWEEFQEISRETGEEHYSHDQKFLVVLQYPVIGVRTRYILQPKIKDGTFSGNLPDGVTLEDSQEE